MKRYSLLFLVLLLLFLTTACNNEPLIEVETIISTIGDEEYARVGGTKDLNDPQQEDFKVLKFKFFMENTNAVTDRQMEIDVDWRNTLNSIDGVDRYWHGSGGEQDNPSENFAEYQQEVVYYAKGLSEEDIKKAFENSKVTVSWTDNKELVEKQYIIADLMEFKE